MKTLAEKLVALERGQVVEFAENTVVWFCELCGVYYATKAEADNCEWLCKNDPEG